MTNSPDVLWQAIRDEVTASAASEPMLASFLHMTVLRHKSFDDVLAFHLSSKLASQTMDARALMELINDALHADPQIAISARADIQAVRDRDPACKAYSTPLLYFKGYQAIQCYRVANWLWREGREALALHLQNRISEVFAVDIHPAANIGKGILLDHGTGFVVGETVVIDDDVSILQEVTLGGTGKETGDRHPKIRSGVLIGAGAKILGNIEIGAGAKVGAGSVVLEPVPSHVTVVGVPARIVGVCEQTQPAQAMDHRILKED
ncbi:serine O-acetyltransferase [Leeia sp. TBRC 13508]|uniref:Serine acetyltransferase n=1 Tax=Leeia speluncae TaxID=2884804 RepID=A0ABS8D4E0_9NEIS|nr:serine O-acetyltransferase [Leeia speluncae]MCB6182997.1 serine O-acetyltransferase [Leeia speluncae]